jgi:hypothetical protein
MDAYSRIILGLKILGLVYLGMVILRVKILRLIDLGLKILGLVIQSPKIIMTSLKCIPLTLSFKKDLLGQ